MAKIKEGSVIMKLTGEELIATEADVIKQSGIEPEMKEGGLWLDTSDVSYENTIFDGLDEKIVELENIKADKTYVDGEIAEIPTPTRE